ncbi:hypothetical protein BSKO_09812 [Bryopsis sp. KO-2023]|nr:hypothetical protein BSKO_09812 [Bryopsis sp. KO-2023]
MRVYYKGNPCELEISEQSFVCSPQGNDAPKRKGCFPLNKSGTTSLEIDFNDIIGAESEGKDGVKIHFTRVSGKAPKRKRALHQSSRITCESADVAHDIISKVRNFATGRGGADFKTELLAILNPASGPGKATMIFEKEVRTLLEDGCGFTVKSRTSAEQGDIVEIVRQADLSSCCGILYFGGDGTVHEGLQGLFSRTDWEVSSKLPFAQFPVGSGNALAASTGLWDVPTAVYAICKGFIEPIDIMSMVQSDRRYFSFLGMMYGALTTLDIGTEDLRWMGEARFTVGAIREIAKLSSYSLKMAYLTDAEEPTTSTPRENAHIATEEFVSLTGPSQSLAEAETKKDGQNFDAISLPGEPSTVLADGGPSGAVIDWFEKAQEGDTGPEGWCMVDSFSVRLSTVLNLPHIALSTKFLPLAKPNDGTMYIVAIPSTTSSSRMQMIDVFLKVDSGDHIQNKAVDVKKVKAVMLSPGRNETAKTWLTMDGEVVPIQPTYIELHPQACRVFTAS